jgi:hypothetical protein
MMSPPSVAGPYLDFIGSLKFLLIYCFSFQYAFRVTKLKTRGPYVEITNQIF